jgi:hypothetical protein
MSVTDLCRHFSTDDVERSENDFERAQWWALAVECPHVVITP